MTINVNPFVNIGYEGAGLTAVKDPVGWLSLEAGGSFVESEGNLRPRFDAYLYGGISGKESKIGLGGRVGPQIPLGRAGRFWLFPFLEQRVAEGLGSYQVAGFPGREEALSELLNGIGVELGCRLTSGLDMKLGGHYLGGWTYVAGPDYGTNGLATGLSTHGGGVWAGLCLNLNRLIHGDGGLTAGRERPQRQYLDWNARADSPAPTSDRPAEDHGVQPGPLVRPATPWIGPSEPSAMVWPEPDRTQLLAPEPLPVPSGTVPLTPAPTTEEPAPASISPAPASQTTAFNGNTAADPLAVPIGSDRFTIRSVAPDIISQIDRIRGYSREHWDYATSGNTLEIFLDVTLKEDSAGDTLEYEIVLKDGRVVPVHGVAKIVTGIGGLIGDDYKMAYPSRRIEVEVDETKATGLSVDYPLGSVRGR